MNRHTSVVSGWQPATTNPTDKHINDPDDGNSIGSQIRSNNPNILDRFARRACCGSIEAAPDDMKNGQELGDEPYP